MGTLAKVEFDAVPREGLGEGGTWRKILLSENSVVGARSCLGYSSFAPGDVTEPIVHEEEEFCFVVKGRGELRGDDQVVAFGERDALLIPAGTWHSIANMGGEEVVMVFGFPAPRYPVTRRR